MINYHLYLKHIYASRLPKCSYSIKFHISSCRNETYKYIYQCQLQFAGLTEKCVQMTNSSNYFLIKLNLSFNY